MSEKVKVVPVEPTREMERAGVIRANQADINQCMTFADCAKIYRTMLAAGKEGK